MRNKSEAVSRAENEKGEIIMNKITHILDNPSKEEGKQERVSVLRWVKGKSEHTKDAQGHWRFAGNKNPFNPTYGEWGNDRFYYKNANGDPRGEVYLWALEYLEETQEVKTVPADYIDILYKNNPEGKNAGLPGWVLNSFQEFVDKFKPLKEDVLAVSTEGISFYLKKHGVIKEGQGAQRIAGIEQAFLEYVESLRSQPLSTNTVESAEEILKDHAHEKWLYSKETVLEAMKEHAQQFQHPQPSLPVVTGWDDLIEFINGIKNKQTLLNGQTIETINISSLLHKIKELSTPAVLTDGELRLEAEREYPFSVGTMDVRLTMGGDVIVQAEREAHIHARKMGVPIDKKTAGDIWDAAVSSFKNCGHQEDPELYMTDKKSTFLYQHK